MKTTRKNWVCVAEQWSLDGRLPWLDNYSEMTMIPHKKAIVQIASKMENAVKKYNSLGSPDELKPFERCSICGRPVFSAMASVLNDRDSIDENLGHDAFAVESDDGVETCSECHNNTRF